MNLLADFIVKRKTYILIVFLLLFVVSIFMMPDRKLSYNIFDILPDDIESLIGLKILSEKIAKGPEFTILCEKDDLNEVENLIRKLETLPYIISISWLGTSQDLTYPEEIWRDSASWYKDGVFKVSITLKSSDSYKTQIEQLRGLLPEWAELTGSEVISYDMEDYFKNSTLIYFSLGILLVTVFLFLTFPSFLVPILIVFSMMIGVIINLAITAVSGRSIYFLMDTIVAILQVAVTLDYALFLYHRYEEERLTKERDAAMASAIISSFKPISLSSLTTMAGFFALTFGKLTIYSILGWILLRGVFISLIVIIFFFSSLLLLSDKFIAARKHRVIPLGVGSLGRFMGRFSHIFSIIFLIFLAIFYYSYTRVEPIFDVNTFLPEDIPSIATLNKINSIFGQTESIIIVAEEDTTGFSDALSTIKNMDGVNAVLHYSTILDPAIPEELIPADVFDRFRNNGYTFALVDINYKLNEENGKTLRNSIEKTIKEKVYGEAYITGESVLLADISDIAYQDQSKTTRISLLLILIIIAIGFTSLSVPLVLVLVIQLAIWANIGYYFLFNIPMPFFIPSILGAIQLGATIDYAVLLTSRYQEERRMGMSRIDASDRSVYWSSYSIITSAGTMILMNLPAAILSNIELVRITMGSLARGGFLSVMMVLFLLPALLVLLDKVFKYSSYKWSGDDKNE